MSAIEVLLHHLYSMIAIPLKCIREMYQQDCFVALFIFFIQFCFKMIILAKKIHS